MLNDKRYAGQSNSGFTLLEVLVAVIVFAIVAVPLLHAFVTAADTNGRAKINMRATTAAENVMESCRYHTMEEIDAKFADPTSSNVTKVVDPTTGAETGKVIYEVTDASLYKTSLPDGYRVFLTLDPTKYPNYNDMNLADLETVSVSDSGVYTMAADYDQVVYNKFVQWNADCHSENPAQFNLKNYDFFKDNLKRRIEIIIKSNGTVTDEEGNSVEIVSVNLNINYRLDNYSGIISNTVTSTFKSLPNGQKVYETTDAEIFNNQATEVPLKSVFLFYTPRYKAGTLGSDREIINVENNDNIDINLFVIEQLYENEDGVLAAEDATTYRDKYLGKIGSNKALTVNVFEKEDGAERASIDFRTNMCENVPNTGKKADGSPSTDGSLLLNLVYRRGASILNALDRMNVRSADGRFLKADNTPNRIFTMQVDVYDNVDTTRPIVSLDGTKIE